MKDMYTFDSDLDAARVTYSTVIDVYSELFNCLEVPWRRVTGDCGDIGGHISDEFHFLSSIGQDSLVVCSKCKKGYNLELKEKSSLVKCSDCEGTLNVTKGIEVAHAFLLGDTYSAKLNATHVGMDRKVHNLQMGCYGIGVSRLIGATVEVLSTESELRWPKRIVPFSACVICPKVGSREEDSIKLANELYGELNDIEKGLFPNDVILDDREKLTVGKKLRDACKLGYNYIILFGKSSIDHDPQVELHCPMPSNGGKHQPTQMTKVPLRDIISVLKEKSLV